MFYNHCVAIEPFTLTTLLSPSRQLLGADGCGILDRLPACVDHRKVSKVEHDALQDILGPCSIYLSISLYIYIYIYSSIYIYIYMYMYIHIHTHLSIYLSIYLSISLSLSLSLSIYIYIFPRGWNPVVPPILAYAMLKKVCSPAREYMF